MTDLKAVDEVVEQGIADGVAPGMCYAVGHAGDMRVKAFGRYMHCPDSPAVKEDTMWDLASVSKVVGCTTAAMILVDEGKLKLDEPVAAVIPDFGRNGKEAVTPRNLLLHNAGFPGWIPYHKTPELTPEECVQKLYDQKPVYPVGTKTIYSDCSMVSLGLVVAKLAGKPMDEFLQERVFGPLRMTRTMYRPARQGMEKQCAPTETLEDWREKARAARHELPVDRGAQCHPDEHLYVQGEVHDPTAYMVGGVSGNAGLFSTAPDLATFCRMMISEGIFWGRRIIQAKTVRDWTHRAIPNDSRGLGWDMKSAQSEMKHPGSHPSAGNRFSMRSFGHTGYTGTSIWVDPVNQMFAVLLTNRVHPTSANEKIAQFRPRFHDAVAEACGVEKISQ